ncbi:MAG: hypothetical protein WC028_31675 [Candidatus Obscuribacterales bacterium]
MNHTFPTANSGSQAQDQQQIKAKLAEQTVNNLLAEIANARAEMGQASVLHSAARQGFNNAKTTLNEPQFTQRLEAVANDLVAAQELIAAQQKRRASYKGAHLALSFAFTRLLRKRDQFQRTLMKLVDSVPHIEDIEMRDWLASQCVEQMLNAHAFNDDVMRQFAKERGDCSKEPDLSDALLAAFAQWREQQWQVQSALIACGPKARRYIRFYQDKTGPEKLSSLNAVPANRGIPLQFITISDCGRQEANRYNHLVEPLMALAEQAQSLTAVYTVDSRGTTLGNLFSTYTTVKAGLNEKQYSQRLQAAITSGDQSSIDSLKTHQQQKRSQLFNVRLSLTRQLYLAQNCASDLMAKAYELVSALDARAEADICGLSKNDDLDMAVITNILAAHEVARSVFAYAAWWQEELNTTEPIGDLTRDSLYETMAAMAAKPPYSNIRWAYSREGKVYTTLPGEVYDFSRG